MKVSVLVPTHRRPQLLREALRSIHGQTMPRDQFEVILANDDATPLPDDVLDGLQGRLIQGPFGGCSAALNAAFAASQGDYITVAADDDLMLPRKLEALCRALDECPPSIVAAFGWPIYTDRAGHHLGCAPMLTAFLTTHPTVTFAHAIEEGLWVHGTGLVYRRSAIQSVGGWDTTLPTAEEFDLHLRLLKFAGDFRAVDTPVVTYRLGGKHARYRGGHRPREHMDRIYEKVA